MQCRPEGLAFVELGPYRFVNEGIVLISAAQLLEIFADARRWRAWFVDMIEAK